ncbi:MAG TPA: tol-pal system protein YbgF [Candidatus Binatia bacterium]|nr:tol-pal system protein YbgF [Candidatus Binatia bacterium]
MVRRLVALAALALAGCNEFGGLDGTRVASPEEQRLQQIEQRLDTLQRRLDNLNLAAQSQETRRLDSDLRTLRGDVEALQNAANQSDKRGRDLYQDLDRRLQKLENENRPARLSMEPRLSNPPPVPATQEEESTYLRVFDLLKNGRYDDAITGFRDLLARWPQGKYADNSWYWLGEAYFIKRDLKAAQDSFQTLLERFPASAKLPDALYRQIEIFTDQKQTDAAKGAYDRLTRDYANSSAAAKARQKFDKLQ